MFSLNIVVFAYLLLYCIKMYLPIPGTVNPAEYSRHDIDWVYNSNNCETAQII